MELWCCKALAAVPMRVLSPKMLLCLNTLNSCQMLTQSRDIIQLHPKISSKADRCHCGISWQHAEETELASAVGKVKVNDDDKSSQT